ncbi:MAG: carboxypeptidase-like regulatory domain-containing protein [bacterium]|nr:carboxypeptidase-like regulatory domain-containing protein [bacterium]
MKMPATCMLLALAAVSFSGCGGPDEEPVADHLWHAEFRVDNSSDLDLRVGLAGPVFGGHTEASAAVPAHTDVTLPMPEAIFWRPELAECVWCVSVRQEPGGGLLRQICPPTDGDWETEETGEYARRFTLRLDAADLEADSAACPVLNGRVVDGLSGEGLAEVSVRLESGAGAAAATDGNGDYTLYLRADLPEGYLYFTKTGYRQVSAEVMSGLTAEGDSRFSLLTTLQRAVP